MTLIVEDGTTLPVNANSYITLEYANDYNSNRVHGQAWAALTDAVKEQSIIYATQIFENLPKWNGYPRYNLASSQVDNVQKVQYLRWPRSGVVDRDGYTLDYDRIPDFLKQASAEFARILSAKDISLDEKWIGFSSLPTAKGSLAIDKNWRQQIIPRSVRFMIQPYCTLDTTSELRRG